VVTVTVVACVGDVSGAVSGRGIPTCCAEDRAVRPAGSEVTA